MWSPGPRPRPRPMANAGEREEPCWHTLHHCLSTYPIDCWALCKGQEYVPLFRNKQGNQRHKPQPTRVDCNSTVTWGLDCTPPITTTSWETGPKRLLLKGLSYALEEGSFLGCPFCGLFLIGSPGLSGLLCVPHACYGAGA